jgi:hypothetical protein
MKADEGSPTIRANVSRLDAGSEGVAVVDCGGSQRLRPDAFRGGDGAARGSQRLRQDAFREGNGATRGSSDRISGL